MRPSRSNAAIAATLLAAWTTVTSCTLLRDQREETPFDIVSMGSGPWSDSNVWQPRRAPRGGDRVHVRAGDSIVYDVDEQEIVRSITVEGTLRFARDRTTELNVGWIRIGPTTAADTGERLDLNDAHAHHPPQKRTGVLSVGTPEQPIPPAHSATIRLHFHKGMAENDAPAIVCSPGGRMDFHGAPMSRTWIKLANPARIADIAVVLDHPPTGWRVFDEILITASKVEQQPDGLYGSGDLRSEHRRIEAIDGTTVRLDHPLDYDHSGLGRHSSEVANLSRNVIVESADPDGVRGHTMYHRYARGSISYSRFAHLGKRSTLGRYPIHFHRVRDTMRGSSVVGAAIVDSHNRWVTIHSTEYLVVRDCVGFQSVGHGFFLEDGSEVYNVLDRNLGVQAYLSRRMPGQAIPYDINDGAAFWWSNGRNTLVRNTTCENDRYGYRFDSRTTSVYDSRMIVLQSDGSRRSTDVRTLPIYRFSDNEAHSEPLYAFSLFGNEGVGPDTAHPSVLKNLTAWYTHYVLHAGIPSLLLERLNASGIEYGIYQPWFENHVYRDLRIDGGVEPFNRGMDDESRQVGIVTVDGLHLTTDHSAAMLPLIQISDHNSSGSAETHIRNLTVTDRSPASRGHKKPLVDRGGGPRPTPSSEHGVPIYLHDHFGSGRHAKVASTAANDFGQDQLAYHEQPGVTGSESRIAEVQDIAFPTLLEPIDEEPPFTVITWPTAGDRVRAPDGELVIRGTTSDNRRTRRVQVNGVDAVDIDYEFHRWQAKLTELRPGRLQLTASGEDETGNLELNPHRLDVEIIDTGPKPTANMQPSLALPTPNW